MNIEDSKIEALIIMQEECGEVVQSIAKIFRFGMNDVYQEISNKERLEKEVGDLLCMVDILIERGVISDSVVNEARHSKREKLESWSNIFK
jgi:NTP pyrophosphatase (non-canonical NTP hydrolase)